jgi:hypothetical protein
MMLKKQTVWLLTMLSLVIVLSVYYLTLESAEEPTNSALDNPATDDKKESAEKETSIQEVTRDEAFEAIRMQLEDERSRRLEELEVIAGSTELTAEERSEAKDEIQKIQEMAEKEQLLETLIIHTLGYEDALVRSNGNEVSITVKGAEPSKQKANEIIQMVRKELGTTFVTVAFQSANEGK